MLKTRKGDVLGSEGKRIFRRRDLPAVTGLGLSTIYELIAAGDFPKPIKLGRRAVGWPEAEIDAWRDARVAERDSGSA